jgi:hypothetical protein
MPSRPLRLTDLGTETGAQVLNQNFRELHGRVDDLQKVLNRRVAGASTLTFGVVPAGGCVDATAYVNGASQQLVAHANPTVDIGANLTHSARVLKQNQVAVRVCNPTTGPLTPNVAKWQIVVA